MKGHTMSKKQDPVIQVSTNEPTSFALPPKHTFPVQELADLLGVNHKTIREQITAGNIQAVRLGRVIRIPRSEVLRLLGQ